MKTNSGLEIKLFVAGAAVEEYEVSDDADDGTTRARYVEAVSGSTFSIQFVAPPGLAKSHEDSVHCSVLLDGKYATGRIIDAALFARSAFTFMFDGIDVMTSRGRELQRFTFAQLNTNDATLDPKAKPEQFGDLGLVTVECKWCRKVSAPFTAIQDSFQPAFGGSSISEKCLKGRAISNQAR